MVNTIYIIGHKSPDLDSVASAISYSNLKNKIDKVNNYIPVIAEKINKETSYVLEKFNFKTPEILNSAKEKNIILTDHNEFSQAVNEIEKAKIIEIIDHHKVNFQYNEPIKITIQPLGASCSLVFEEYFKNNVVINKNIAGLMLSAILVDTVITKSPTCSPKDVEIIEKLTKISKINNWKEFGMELFKVRSDIKELSDIELIKSDYKDFNSKSGKVGIGQIETVDLTEFESREKELLNKLNILRKTENYHTVILFITDIIKEGSKFLISTCDQKKVEKVLNIKLKNNKVYINGVISRKKQVAPKFTENF